MFGWPSTLTPIHTDINSPVLSWIIQEKSNAEAAAVGIIEHVLKCQPIPSAQTQQLNEDMQFEQDMLLLHYKHPMQNSKVLQDHDIV